jgi:hypothetical protein
LGDSNYAPATDYTGVANVRANNPPPDIGAYEYVPAGGDNHAPVLTAIGAQSVYENRALSFDINATDEDPGDTLVFSCDNLPSGATLNSATGEFAWTPSYRESGIYDLSFVVSDGDLQDSEVVRVTVTNSPQGLIAR